jgi:hypothetical protein
MRTGRGERNWNDRAKERSVRVRLLFDAPRWLDLSPFFGKNDFLLPKNERMDTRKSLKIQCRDSGFG